MISSAIPSAKYSCSGSPLMFWNGSTAMEGLSGNGGGLSAGLRNTRGSLSLFTVRTHLIGPDWLLNVLHLLSTKVHEGHRQDLAHLIARRPGDTHGSGGCHCL